MDLVIIFFDDSVPQRLTCALGFIARGESYCDFSGTVSMLHFVNSTTIECRIPEKDIYNSELSIIQDGVAYGNLTVSLSASGIAIQSITSAVLHNFGGESFTVHGMFYDYLDYTTIFCRMGVYETSAIFLNSSSITCTIPRMKSGKISCT